MLFYFADRGVWAKRPVPESWQKRSIAKTELLTEKRVTFVIPAFRLIMEHH